MTTDRRLVSGLNTPHPLAPLLPALYQGDSFTIRLLSALDEVLAPVIGALDSLAAYFDPTLAPIDFLEWLAAWLGIELDERWPEAQKRAVVAGTAELYHHQGTVAGLIERVRLAFGYEPEIEESGGAVVSEAPGGPLPGRPDPHLVVRLRLPEPTERDQRRLDALVAAIKPAHVPHLVEVLPR
jgi:phage tail-like protein